MKLPEVVYESLKKHVAGLKEEVGQSNRSGVAGVAKAKKVKK